MRSEMMQSDIYERYGYGDSFIIESFLGFSVVNPYTGFENNSYQVLEVNGDICTDRFADRLIRYAYHPIAFKSLADAECAMPFISELCEMNDEERMLRTALFLKSFLSVVHSSDRQFGWNWVDSTEGYEGFMDDYGTFIPEWVVMP